MTVAKILTTRMTNSHLQHRDKYSIRLFWLNSVGKTKPRPEMQQQE